MCVISCGDMRLLGHTVVAQCHAEDEDGCMCLCVRMLIHVSSLCMCTCVCVYLYRCGEYSHVVHRKDICCKCECL